MHREGALLLSCNGGHLLRRWLTLLVILATMAVGSACGGSSASNSASPPPAQVSVAISPRTATLTAGQAQGQTFSALVLGTNDHGVTWSVQEGAIGGTIQSSGQTAIYFAPQNIGTFHIVATSQADPTKVDVATVNVTVGLVVSPSDVDLGLGATQTFTAMVTGSANTAVNWKVQEGAAGGTITTSGVYTAPQKSGTYHVTATSQADHTAMATACVNVSVVTVTLYPTVDTLGPKGVRAFSAWVTGTNAQVAWSIAEGTVGGSITDMGVYTAPVSPGNFHVVATVVADPSVSATANISVVLSGFLQTGSMAFDRAQHTATRLPDGRVLITGGFVCAVTPDGCDGIPLGSAEIFDPATATFAQTGSLGTARSAHTATLLGSGKVLVAGGYGTSAIVASSELFDPATGSFAATGGLLTPRWNHAATLLPNGQVLITGGLDNAGHALSTAELFDPASGTFLPTGSMTTGRAYHTATPLPNGQVFIAGGYTGSAWLSTAELFDPSSGTFTPTGNMITGRAGHTATMLASGGKVLIAGGFNLPGQTTNTAELFNPATGTFAATGAMTMARAYATATLLPSGDVLIAGGGEASYGVTFAAELFDGLTGTFAATGSMAFMREFHTVTLLQNGTVLVTGGSDECGETNATAEIYK